MNKLISILFLTVVSISCNGKTVERVKKNTHENDLTFNTLTPSNGEGQVDIWDRIDEKAKWFKTDAKYSSDINDVPKEFSIFYIDFLSDSIKQKRGIDFSDFTGVMGECDTTILLNSNNWEYTKWNFIEHFTVDNDSTAPDGWNNKIYYSDNKFYYEFQLNEVGVIYQVGFEQKENGWKMTLYYVNNC